MRFSWLAGLTMALWLAPWQGAAQPLDTVNGLYPLWEQTGVLHPAGVYQVGYGHAQLGLGRVQVATQPFLDVYGTWNLQAKVALWRGERMHVALATGVYRVPTAAEARGIGNLRAPGFSNPYAPVWLIPVSVAKSFALTDRIAVHWASTMLICQGGVVPFVSGGQTLLIEARASPRWAARAHAGVEGLRVFGQGHAGVSFAYRGDVALLEVGAARRFTFEGEQSNVFLFDVGLLFR